MDSVVPMDSVVLLAVIFVISTSSQLRTSSFGSLLQKNHRGSLGSFALVLLLAKEPVPIAKEPSLEYRVSVPTVNPHKRARDSPGSILQAFQMNFRCYFEVMLVCRLGKIINKQLTFQ